MVTFPHQPWKCFWFATQLSRQTALLHRRWAIETERGHLSWSIAKPYPLHRLVVLACLVATLSYLASRLGGALILRPQMVSPLWLGNVLLVSVLLLVRRRIWPVLLAAGLAGFFLFDLQAGGPIRSIVWLILSNAVEVLIAALCLSYSFDGVPRLNSVKALAKYSFYAVFLAPFVGAFLGALSTRTNYWASWKVAFFSEAIGFLTLMPAILGWATEIPAWAQKPRAYYLEAAALIAALVLLGFLIFVVPQRSLSPALLYSLVPFLLWSAFRFGSTGVSTSVLIIAFLSIWGVTHGEGPFAGPGQLNSVLPLQLFLFFTAAPFMVLAVLVEERMRAEEDLREGEERLRLAMEAGKLGGWEWEPQSGRIPWFSGTHTQFGMTPTDRPGSAQDFWDRVHPEDRDQLRKAIEIAKQDRVEFDQEFRVVWPDGTVHWLRSIGRFFFTAGGEPERMMGISRDITERKHTERALRQREAELSEAQRLAKLGSWQWDPETDTVTWSEELYRIAGRDPNLSAVSYKDHAQLYTPESWERLRSAVEEALRTGTPYELDLEMVRSDGTTRWLIARGEARRNASGQIVQLLGTVQDITDRKRAEKTLGESEERFRLAAQAGKMYAYDWDVATDAVVRSAEGRNILGLTGEPMHLTRQQVLASVHPDDRAMFTAAVDKLTPENPTTHITYRVLRPDDAVIWLEKTARAFFDGQGRMMRMIGMVVDATERKRTEEALSSVSRRLIEAQEQERARIARELHDDLSQRMALLQIGLEQFEQDTAGLSSKARQQLRTIAEVASEVSSNIHGLSHQLHPSKLDTLGLVASLGGFCRELTKQHGLQIEFVHQDVPGQIPKEVTLCLFRIVQEGLRNVVKHSGAEKANLELAGHADEIDLYISDFGRGFDPESVDGNAGLGLISMRERLRLVRGHLSIESRPSHGTRIHVRVPLSATNAQVTTEDKAHRARA